MPAMLFLSILVLHLSSLTFAQTTCRLHTPPSSGRVVLTYTPYVTPQAPPLSTVYRHFVTAWTYAVDCRYVSISQVDDNQPVTGRFIGTPTTVDALTITRIGCIQQTSAITRRDLVRGFPAEPTETVAEHVRAGKRDLSHVKRASMKEDILSAVEKQAADIPPDAREMSVRAYGYLVQVNTAIFALNLYNTGFNMSATCELLNDPITQARLILASVNPSQAEAIICYAAQYGLYFDMSNAQLLSELLSIIYSIEIKSGFTTNTTAICDQLDLGPAGFLGVDTDDVESYICGDQPSSTNSSRITTTLVEPTRAPSTNNSTNSVGVSVSTLPPFANSTVSGIAANSTASVGVGATGTGGLITSVPANSTSRVISRGTAPASESFDIVFPNTTTTVNGSFVTGGREPPSPTSALSYELWTTSTTQTVRLPRY